jgi:hypothetical protein
MYVDVSINAGGKLTTQLMHILIEMIWKKNWNE